MCVSTAHFTAGNVADRSNQESQQSLWPQLLLQQQCGHMILINVSTGEAAQPQFESLSEVGSSLSTFKALR